MKKTLLLLSLASTLALSDTYIGIGGSLGKTDISIKDKVKKGLKSNSNNRYKSKDNSSALNLILGYERDNKDRIEAKIYRNKITYKNEGKRDNSTVKGIDLTYSFDIKALNTGNFSPYFKAGVGYQKADIKFEADYQESSSKKYYGKYDGSLDAFTLPLSIGSFYKISKEIELDFGLLYRTALYQDVQLNKKANNSKLAVLETSLHSTELYFGVNYKF